MAPLKQNKPKGLTMIGFFKTNKAQAVALVARLSGANLHMLSEMYAIEKAVGGLYT